jgi:hypothetical protein
MGNISLSKKATQGSGQAGKFKLRRAHKFKAKNVQEPTPEEIEAHKRAVGW